MGYISASLSDVCTSVIQHKAANKPEVRCGRPLLLYGDKGTTAMVCPTCDCLDHNGTPMLREREQ
jgi:hypothetical protein